MRRSGDVRHAGMALRCGCDGPGQNRVEYRGRGHQRGFLLRISGFGRMSARRTALIRRPVVHVIGWALDTPRGAASGGKRRRAARRRPGAATPVKIRRPISNGPGFHARQLASRAGNQREPVRYMGCPLASPAGARGCSSMVEPQPSKLVMRVRFPSSALVSTGQFRTIIRRL